MLGSQGYSPSKHDAAQSQCSLSDILIRLRSHSFFRLRLIFVDGSFLQREEHLPDGQEWRSAPTPLS
jgi:hypothetical protein